MAEQKGRCISEGPSHPLFCPALLLLLQVVNFLKKTLGEKVEKVTVSDRLTDSPCALVTSKFGWSANMERIMKSQAFGDTRTMDYMKVCLLVGSLGFLSHLLCHKPMRHFAQNDVQGKKIMEINPDHDVIKGLRMLLVEKDEDRARDLSELLFETSLLTSGFAVESPRDYASKVFTLMKIALGYDISEPSQQQQQQATAETTKPLTQVEPEVVDPNDPWNKKG